MATVTELAENKYSGAFVAIAKPNNNNLTYVVCYFCNNMYFKFPTTRPNKDTYEPVIQCIACHSLVCIINSKDTQTILFNVEISI
jgi:hypothetical protein